MGLDASAQFAAASIVRQRVRPPIYRRLDSLGSISNGAMNWKFGPGSLMPRVVGLNPTPPLVDFNRDRFVVSANRILGSLGSIATKPPSPPNTRRQSVPEASEPRLVPVSCAPAR